MTKAVSLTTPSVPTIKAHISQGQKENLSPTDAKTNRCVVVGAILKGIGLVFAAASIVITFVITPIAIAGLIPAVAFGVLGYYLANRKPALANASTTTKIPPKPPIPTPTIPKKPDPETIKKPPKKPEDTQTGSVTKPKPPIGPSTTILNPEPGTIKKPPEEPQGSVTKPTVINPPSDSTPDGTQTGSITQPAQNPGASQDGSQTKPIDDKKPGEQPLVEEPKKPGNDKDGKGSSAPSSVDGSKTNPPANPDTLRETRDLPVKPFCLATIGSAQAPQAIQTPPPAPSVPRLAPIGIENKSCNCWINSLLQMFINIPSLNQRLHSLEDRYEFLQKLKKNVEGEDKDRYKAITDFVKLYEKQQKAKRPITDKEASQKVRLCLHEMFPNPRNGISKDYWRQEDASQGMLFLLRDVDFILKTLFDAVPPAPFFILEQTSPKERQFEFHTAIDLTPDSDGKLSFMAMLKNYFRNDEIVQSGKIIGPNDERQYKGHKWYHLQTPPPELLIPINRFAMDPLTGERTKNNNTFVVPENFTMPAEYIRSGEAGKYELDAFIEHSGLTMSSGHYICYLKINKKWYRISDSDVEEINPANLKKKRDKAYIYHFTRV